VASGAKVAGSHGRIVMDAICFAGRYFFYSTLVPESIKKISREGFEFQEDGNPYDEYLDELAEMYAKDQRLRIPALVLKDMQKRLGKNAKLYLASNSEDDGLRVTSKKNQKSKYSISRKKSQSSKGKRSQSFPSLSRTYRKLRLSPLYSPTRSPSFQSPTPTRASPSARSPSARSPSFRSPASFRSPGAFRSPRKFTGIDLFTPPRQQSKRNQPQSEKTVRGRSPSSVRSRSRSSSPDSLIPEILFSSEPQPALGMPPGYFTAN
jgi:hypothetical protein